MRARKPIIAGVLSSLALYAGYPALTLYQLQSAVRDGNATTLSRLIDWPAVRQGDDQWYEIVKWTLNALIEAEEQGITQANVEGKLASDSPTVKRLLGVTGDYGKFMALDNRWAFNAIKAVGNYGEVFDRNFGPLKMARGKNALWSKGGLMYSAPVR